MTRLSGLLRHFDASWLLTVYLVLLLLVPSRLVFSPLGGVGSPQELWGLLLLGLWGLFLLQRKRPLARGRQPVRLAYFLVLASFSASFVVAMSRPIDPAESSTALQALIQLFSWGGVLLFTADLVRRQRDLETILRRIVFLGGVLATLAIAQFITGNLIVDRIWFPGLTANADQTLGAIGARGGLNRPSATAIHPIEFGAVITMILPLAVTFAMHDRARNSLRRWSPVLLIAFATFMSVSRSALLSGGVAMLVLWVSWPWSYRRRALGAVVAFLAVIALIIPGMLRTLFDLFSSIGTDSSAASRTSSYPIAIEFITRSPVFGRGFGTFLPSLHIFDNAFLGMMVEVGLLGLVLVLVLLLTGMASGQKARRVAPGPRARALGHALTASIAAGSVGLALYDGFGFPMGAAMIFLFLGFVGAARRLAILEARFARRARGREQAPARAPAGRTAKD